MERGFDALRPGGASPAPAHLGRAPRRRRGGAAAQGAPGASRHRGGWRARAGQGEDLADRAHGSGRHPRERRPPARRRRRSSSTEREAHRMRSGVTAARCGRSCCAAAGGPAGAVRTAPRAASRAARRRGAVRARRRRSRPRRRSDRRPGRPCGTSSWRRRWRGIRTSAAQVTRWVEFWRTTGSQLVPRLPRAHGVVRAGGGLRAFRTGACRPHCAICPSSRAGTAPGP